MGQAAAEVAEAPLRVFLYDFTLFRTGSDDGCPLHPHAVRPE